ncbi:MAG: sel1 repeat family protein [Gammaproteobacteria bacterium]|nr:MAG: sel1 repeat family protein [Gammaproteobacteria bacterium]
MPAVRALLILLLVSAPGWAAPEPPDWSKEQAAGLKGDEQLELGLAHVAQQHYVEARRWFESAAAEGESRAKLNLGWLHEEGLLGTVDGDAAIDWYTRGVLAGESAYATKLAWIHLQGQLVQSDLATAERWFRYAIDAGHPEGQLGLGSVVLAEVMGGDSQRIDEALKLFSDALEHGLMLASYYLGRIYREGLGVPPDPTLALDFYTLGAEAGLADVQWRLGEMYAEGVGTERDLILAAKWAYLAAANGASESLGLIAEVEAELDRDDIAEARRQAWLEAGGSASDLD